MTIQSAATHASFFMHFCIFWICANKKTHDGSTLLVRPFVYPSLGPRLNHFELNLDGWPSMTLVPLLFSFILKYSLPACLWMPLLLLLQPPWSCPLHSIFLPIHLIFKGENAVSTYSITDKEHRKLSFTGVFHVTVVKIISGVHFCKFPYMQINKVLDRSCLFIRLFVCSFFSIAAPIWPIFRGMVSWNTESRKINFISIQKIQSGLVISISYSIIPVLKDSIPAFALFFLFRKSFFFVGLSSKRWNTSAPWCAQPFIFLLDLLLRETWPYWIC